MPNRLRPLVTLTLMTSIFAATTSAQPTAELIESTAEQSQVSLHLAPPNEVGLSPEKLALVPPALQKFVDDGKVAGAVVGVIRHGKIALLHAVGYADLDAQEPMQVDSIMRFYSMTKPITSVAVMMLVEEGKIDLDAPVSEYLPEFADVKVYAGESDDGPQLVDPERPMTVRDLLRHTSGLTYGFFGNTKVDQMYRAAAVMNPQADLEQMVAKLAELPLLYQPGTRFNYSLSTDVLGYLVEKVSGQPFQDFLDIRIFQPLGMTDTAFYVAEENVNRFVNNYGPRPGAEGLRIVEEATKSNYLKPPKLYSGGGGLTSTASDYLRFCQLLLNKGELDGKRLLKTETVEAMTRNQLPEAAYPMAIGEARDGVGFGLGFSVVVEESEFMNAARVGEYGWGGAASTHFWVSPNDDLAVVALSQYMPFQFLLEEAVKPLVYDAIVE